MSLITHFSNFVSAHSICLLFFAIMYYILLSDIDEHFLIHPGLTKEFYTSNKLLHSVYMSASIQSSTGYIELVCKSNIAIFIFTCHTIITLLITLHVIHLFITK